VPGVISSALCDTLPTYGFFNAYAVSAVGAVPAADGAQQSAYFNPVTLDYFATLGMKIRQGRNFNNADRDNSQPVVIINRALAERFWPNENPIGKHITTPLSPDSRWQVEVVGVVNDVSFSANPYPRTRLQMYFPISQKGGNYLYLAVRTSVAPESLSDAARRAVSRIDPDLALTRVASVDQISVQNGASVALLTSGLMFIAAAGLVLSALGLYGVIANLVTERTSEIGIRIALGAQPRDVVGLVLGQGIRLAAFGLSIGLIGAWILARILGSYMPGVLGQDPMVVISCSLLLLGVTLLACWLPVLRATKVDPIVALRCE
jgi:predicted permease